jgi:hypothetical protein
VPQLRVSLARVTGMSRGFRCHRFFPRSSFFPSAGSSESRHRQTRKTPRAYLDLDLVITVSPLAGICRVFPIPSDYYIFYVLMSSCSIRRILTNASLGIHRLCSKYGSIQGTCHHVLWRVLDNLGNTKEFLQYIDHAKQNEALGISFEYLESSSYHLDQL